MNTPDRAPQQAILADICKALGAAKDLPDVPVTGFMAMEGANYSGDLMWIGRAVNGWGSVEQPTAQLADGLVAAGFVQSALQSVQRPSPVGHLCPMRWVSDQWGTSEHGYNTKGSAFWRTAARVMQKIAGPRAGAAEWPSQMIWSNLYKISPASGWNPGSRLAAVQRDGCRRLLSLEIATYRPRNIVFATGSDWASAFLDPETFRNTSKAGGPVIFGETFIEGKVIGRYAVARHPMGKSESKWVQQVIEALGLRDVDQRL